MKKPVYRASTLKRERRSAARLEQLDQQIIAALENDHPQSVRHVFYLMTDPRLPEPVEKSDRGSLHLSYTVEAKAMPAHLLRALLRVRVEDLLPVGASEVSKVAEESEREGLLALAETLGG